MQVTFAHVCLGLHECNVISWLVCLEKEQHRDYDTIDSKFLSINMGPYEILNKVLLLTALAEIINTSRSELQLIGLKDWVLDKMCSDKWNSEIVSGLLLNNLGRCVNPTLVIVLMLWASVICQSPCCMSQ